jgi:hypothetical protein
VAVSNTNGTVGARSARPSQGCLAGISGILACLVLSSCQSVWYGYVAPSSLGYRDAPPWYVDELKHSTLDAWMMTDVSLDERSVESCLAYLVHDIDARGARDTFGVLLVPPGRFGGDVTIHRETMSCTGFLTAVCRAARLQWTLVVPYDAIMAGKPVRSSIVVGKPRELDGRPKGSGGGTGLGPTP